MIVYKIKQVDTKVYEAIPECTRLYEKIRPYTIVFFRTAIVGTIKFWKGETDMSEVLKQDLSQEADSPDLFMIELLFEDKPALLEPEMVKAAAEEKFGEVDAVSTAGEMLSFAVKKYAVHFENGDVPPLAVLGQGLEFDGSEISEFERYQLWDVQDGGELLDRCRYRCFITVMMGSAMEYKDRCELLMDWLECVLGLFSDCKAVWTPTAGKLLTPEQVMENSGNREVRFIRNCVNARFFNIDGTDGDMIVDTLGDYAIDLPDIQVHFRGLEVDDVVNYVYNMAFFFYITGETVHIGEVVDGLDENGEISTGVEWGCQFEDSLIQPARLVLDIAPGEYAAGTR